MRSFAIALLGFTVAGCVLSADDDLTRPPPPDTRLILKFESAPLTGVAGRPLDPITVMLVDAADNLVVSEVISVVLTLRDTASGVEDDVGLARTSGGRATFNAFVERAGTYRWIATSPNAASATSDPFTIESAANRLRFNVEPSDVFAEDPIRPPVEVSITDNGGRPLTLSGIEVRLGGSDGSLAAARTIGGTAVFDALSFSNPGNYQLLAEADDIVPATSRSFTVRPRSDHLVFIHQPPATVAIDEPIPFGIEVHDATGAKLDRDALVTITAEDGAAILDGTLSRRARDGYVLFDDITCTRPGTLRLVASSPGLEGAISDPIQVTDPQPQVMRVFSPSGAEPAGTNSPSLSHDGELLVYTLTGMADPAGGWTQAGAGVYLYHLDRGTQELISVGLDGQQGNNWDGDGRISGNGLFVAFNSGSTNHLPVDQNGFVADAFVRDLSAQTTSLLGVDTQWAGGSFVGAKPISDDGNWVLVSETNPYAIHLRDKLSGTMALIAITGTAWRSAISGDGRFIVFEASDPLVPEDTNPFPDIYLYSRDTQITELVSINPSTPILTVPDDPSAGPYVSGDGSIIAFTSWATNLIAGDTNMMPDVFVLDRGTSTLERINLHTGGAQANGASYVTGMSADGRFIVFTSNADNLVDTDVNANQDGFVHDRLTGTTALVTVNLHGAQGNGQVTELTISGDGRTIAFATHATNFGSADNNGQPDIYVTGNPLAP